MKHAILVGVRDDDPDYLFDPSPSLTAMAELLEGLGAWSVSRLEGEGATRERILVSLAELEGRLGPDDAVLFYFFGHGGVVEILDLPPPFGGRPVFYLATVRTEKGWHFKGVLDIELSAALARLDRRCANVSAILDSCFSAQLVRGPVWSLPESPDWLRALAERGPQPDTAKLLHPSSHPRLVRLAASSSLRKGFGDEVDGGNLGRLTNLFCQVVREAGERVDRLSWDALAHRVREQAIWRLGCEEQWVSLAGPRQRLLFSRDEAPLPRSVGFVPREEGPGGWIRAGLLQGVELGDEWGLAELLLDEELRPRWRAKTRVVEVDLNRALLEPVSGDASGAPPGASALLLRAASRDLVRVDDASLRDAVAASAWLEAEAEDEAEVARATASIDGEGGLELRCTWAEFAPMRVRADEAGRVAALGLLEDWARARRLLAVASSGTDSLVRVTLRYAQRPGAALRRVEAGARLREGGRLVASVGCESRELGCFVSVVVIDAQGRPALLDDAEPEGVELLPGESRDLGVPPRGGDGGFELSWPAGADRGRSRPFSVIVLASRRPIALAHLVRATARAGIPSDRPRRSRNIRRAIRSEPRPRTGPELVYDWGASIVEFELEGEEK